MVRSSFLKQMPIDLSDCLQLFGWFVKALWVHVFAQEMLSLPNSTVIASNILLVDEIMRAGMSSLKGWWSSDEMMADCTMTFFFEGWWARSPSWKALHDDDQLSGTPLRLLLSPSRCFCSIWVLTPWLVCSYSRTVDGPHPQSLFVFIKMFSLICASLSLS